MARVFSLLMAAASFLVAGCANTGAGSATTADRITTEEFMVPARDPGIRLYVRNKRPAGTSSFPGERVVLFVHGATYPASTAFDLPLGGMSWMDFIARQGYDVYLVDVRGYGRSTRPPEMDQPADRNRPIVTTDVAARDVAAVVDFIRERRGVTRINLLAWSWGTAIMALYTSQNNDKVNKLVLYAPSWIRTTPSLVQTSGPLGAYRTVRKDAAKGRWLTGVPEGAKADLIPAGWFEAWADATWATDPMGSKQDPPVLRAPNGVVFDSQTYWTQGKPVWNAEEIRVPVMLVKAEWDSDTPAYMAQALFPKLVNAPYKVYTELGGGTHTIMMEKNRLLLFNAVQAFLDGR